MWHDVETTKDLLNFTIVADTAAQLVRESAGRPLSIRVSGSWDTEKSSLFKMTGSSLKNADADDGKYMFLEFNAWLYQGRLFPENLMVAILSRLAYCNRRFCSQYLHRQSTQPFHYEAFDHTADGPVHRLPFLFSGLRQTDPQKAVLDLRRYSHRIFGRHLFGVSGSTLPGLRPSPLRRGLPDLRLFTARGRRHHCPQKTLHSLRRLRAGLSGGCHL